MSNVHNRFLLLAGLFCKVLLLSCVLEAQNTADSHPAAAPKTTLKATDVGSVRDSMVHVKGTLTDKEENAPMSNVRVFFTRREKRLMVGVLANEKGEFSRKIAPGLYDIEAQFTGKSALKVENYRLVAGASYIIRIEMSTDTSRAIIERKK
jgi:hypothetical protein